MSSNTDVHRRILIVIPRLIAGGSERVLTTIAKKLDRERFQVHVAVLSNDNPNQLDVFPSHIALHRLNVSRARYAGLALLRLIWTLHPHVVLAAGGVSGVLAVATAKLTCTPVIVRQGTMPVSSALRLQDWAGSAFAWSQRNADRVICQSTAMAREVVTASGVAPQNVRLLFNPVQQPETSGTEARTADHLPRLLVVSRLAPEKQIDLVIRAVAILKREYPEATLTILGEGPCRQELEALAFREVCDNSVRFAGYQADPIRWMRRSNLLVMASEFEGLPNVVLEALSVGLPVVAIACPGGLADIAETTSSVTLVDEATPSALADAMMQAITQRTSELPAAPFWNRFGMNVVIRQYEQLLSE